MKRTWLIFLVLLALFAPAALLAQLTWTTNGAAITITAYTGAGCDVLIPALIDNLPVTSIGAGAFSNLAGLTAVTIPGSVSNLGEDAFENCTNLTGVYFIGNPPSADSTVFASDTNATVYYLPGATGWISPFAGCPAVLWNPLIQTNGAGFGVQNNQFGFTVTGPTNIVVVVEASTNLAGPAWTPLQTFTLTNGSAYFSEPLQTTSAARYYGLGFPSGNSQTITSSPSPVLRWKMNEGAGLVLHDSSGNGYDGALTNAYEYYALGQPDDAPQWITGPNGMPALACENFNQTTGHLQTVVFILGNSTIPQLSNVQRATVSVWLLCEAASPTRDYISAGLCGNLTTGTANYSFAANSSGDEGDFYCYIGNASFSWPLVYDYSPGWHNVTTTFDGTQSVATNRVHLYVDGLDNGFVVNGPAFPTNLPSAANVGVPVIANNVNNAGIESGSVCDFQLFDITLTSKQVMAIYSAGAQ